MADGSFISAQQFEGVRPLVSLVYNSMAKTTDLFISWLCSKVKQVLLKVPRWRLSIHFASGWTDCCTSAWSADQSGMMVIRWRSVGH